MTCVRFGPIAVVQLENVTPDAGVGRTLGTLPFKARAVSFGCLNVGSVAGYAKVDTEGRVFCFSASSGNFSGQVVVPVA